MAIGKITGQMLNYNLDRSGSDLVIDGNLAYFDVSNRRIGIGTTTPGRTLDVKGNAYLGNIYLSGGAVTTDPGVKLNLGNINDIQISGGQNNYVIFTDGNGNLSFGNVSVLATIGAFSGADIVLGANTEGAFVSNAVTLTSTTSITNGIALINQALGRLVPPSPPVFPAGQSLTMASTTVTARMTSFSQTNNTQTGSKSVAGGTTVAAVRGSGYVTSQISGVGPGDSGNVQAWLNSRSVGNRIMTTGTDNGTYGNLVIASDQDYRIIAPTTPAGFYQSFNAYAAGTVQQGWNEVYLTHSAGSATNTLVWYYDASNPGAPFWSNVSMPLISNSVSYSSTIPHLTSSAVFRLRGNVANLSGDMYYISDTFVVGTAGGPCATPASVTYAQASVNTPLARNLFTSLGSAYLQTNVSVISGFGSSASGPSLTAYNSYSSTAQVFSPGATVLYKTGTGNQIEETSVPVTAVGIGSGNAFRILNPGATDTPAYTGTELAFNSQTSSLTTSDATVVGAILRHDVTNYSVNYLPVGPNLSATQAANQYFTLKFVRVGVSKFDIVYTGTVAGIFVCLPGVSNGYSTLNGWYDLSLAYVGSGIPGAGPGGNGSNGCALGGTVPVNTAQVARSITATFGSLSSSSSINNEIYVRFKLTAGQTVSAIAIQTASR